MRTSLRIILGISLAILMAGFGVAVVEGRRAVSNELRAEFADSSGDQVTSDGRGAYVSSDPRHRYDAVFFEREYGSIQISVGSTSPAGRYLNLHFADMLDDYRIVESGGDGYDCRDYLGAQMNVPEFQMPPIPLPGSAETTSFFIQTLAKVTYNAASDKWESTGTTFNVRDNMAVGETVYVGLNFNFKAAGKTFWLAFNEKHWGGLDLRLVPGFAQVTRTGPSSWVLRPMALTSSPPLPNATEEYVADFFVYVPAVKKVHGAGYCDLGDWRMPFSITLTQY